MHEQDGDFDKVSCMGLIKETKSVGGKDHEVQTAVELLTTLERAVGCSLEGTTSSKELPTLLQAYGVKYMT